MVPASTPAQEAEYVAQQILALRERGTALPNIAVLFRAASTSQRLEMELLRRDIPYEFRGGLKFFERAHVKDVVCFLRAAHNHQDEPAWLRVLGLHDGVGFTTAEKIFAHVRRCESFDHALASPPALSAKAGLGWTQFMKTAQALQRSRGFAGAMIRAAVGGPYRDYVLAEYPDGSERLEDIEQLAIFADSYKEVQGFLDEVSLSEQFGAGRARGDDGTDEKIVLSTIHQAKGLEWDTVFVIGLSDGQFPHARALAEEDGIEEERRLFYVATTRARRQLFLTYSIMSGYDALIINQPSMFLQELPRGLCEEVRLRHAYAPAAPRSGGTRREAGDAWEPMIVLNDLGEKE